jgi:hypothetical protein
VPSAQFPGSFSIVGPPFDLVALNALRTDDEMISCSSVGKGRSSTPTTRKSAQNQSCGASRKVPALTPTRKDEKKSVSSVPRESSQPSTREDEKKSASSVPLESSQSSTRKDEKKSSASDPVETSQSTTRKDKKKRASSVPRETSQSSSSGTSRKRKSVHRSK